MNNEFVDIPGMEGYYQINLNQEVRSIDRYVFHWCGGQRLMKGKMLSHVNTLGYKAVMMSIENERKLVKVHRLMALTFLVNPENKPEINHKNGIKSDNRIENLEWATSSENQIHAFKTGLQVGKSGVDNPMYGKRGQLSHEFGKFGEESNNARIILDTSTGIYYFGLPEASRAKNMNKSNLGARLYGTVKNDTGLIFV